ncbi:MAG: flagellar hook-basal body complex protein FliE [Melioribacteraceae bacterium]|nr:flagellar hook-basal body complex protein FliE [Melioribacteraceae bacterium]
MKIGDLQSIKSAFPISNNVEKTSGGEFKDLMSGLLEEVKNNQAESNSLTEQLINGGDVELHEVMIAGQKAKTSLQLLMEIRNKALDMYKELTRIPI